MQLEHMDLIYLSTDRNPECERQFTGLKQRYPRIKRLHGILENIRALSICSAMSDTKCFAVITDDKTNYNNYLSKSLNNTDYNLNEIGRYLRIKIYKQEEVQKIEEVEQTLKHKDSKLDIVYLTYEEKDVDSNFLNIKKHYPYAMRLHGVKGLTRAFKLSAELASTSWYILIDGDNEILPSFDLSSVKPPENQDHVKIFFSINPVNGLTYGYGGVKVCPTVEFRQITNDSIDPIVSGSLKPIFDENGTVASITRFNTSAFSAWKAGFRESSMLTAQVDKIRGVSPEWAIQKLQIWKTVGADQPFGDWTITGAQDGEAFVKDILTKIPTSVASETVQEKVKQGVVKINDPVWLKDRFENLYMKKL